jgi:hypothetical protein
MLSGRRVVRNPITGEEIVYEKGQKPMQQTQPQQDIVQHAQHESDKFAKIDPLFEFNNMYLADQPKITTQNANNNRAQKQLQQQPTKAATLINYDTWSQHNNEFMSQVGGNDSSKASNFATKGGSSIPMLNFNDLASEDRPSAKDTPANAKGIEYNLNNQKINYKQELANLVEKQAILSDLKNSRSVLNPIFGVSAAEASVINSTRVQNDFSKAKEPVDRALDSPIIRFQKQKMTEEAEKKNKSVTVAAPVAVVSPLVSQLDAPRNDESKENAPHWLTLDHLKPLPKGPLTEKKNSIYKIERVADLEKLWLESSGMTSREKNGVGSGGHNEYKSNFMKEKLVMDTIVTDQLSTFPNSNSAAAKYKTIYTARGNRHTIIDNHLSPISSLSENVLAKKCKFSTRVRTPNGKIALRELFGLLFMYDGSLTVYEFRLLGGASMMGGGSSGTALPFINRRVYTHAFGRRKNRPIEIWDLFKGSVLYLPTAVNAESSLPTTARHSDYIELEIVDVDEVAKENLLTQMELSNVKLSSHEMSHNAIDIKQRLAQPYSDLELTDRKILGNIRMFFRKQIEDRSVEVYMGLSRMLKAKSSRQSEPSAAPGHVTLDMLHDALLEYNIQIHSEDLNIAWQVLDLEACGHLSYYVLLRALLGEMGLTRHGPFRSLIRKLDAQKTGYVQVNDIYKYYRIARHPRVRSGDVREEDFKSSFLRTFDLLLPRQVPEFFALSTTADTKSPIIAYEQFEEYYNGLSITVDTDEDFLKILKNSWNLS